MTVEEMIDEVKSAIQRHSVGVAMGQWDSAYSATDQFAEAVFIGLFSLGIPLETLAALKAGTWMTVPVSPTDEMARPLTRSWLLAEQEPTAEDMHLARQYAAIMLAAAPAKPEGE